MDCLHENRHCFFHPNLYPAWELNTQRVTASIRSIIHLWSSSSQVWAHHDVRHTMLKTFTSCDKLNFSFFIPLQFTATWRVQLELPLARVTTSSLRMLWENLPWWINVIMRGVEHQALEPVPLVLPFWMEPFAEVSFTVLSSFCMKKSFENPPKIWLNGLFDNLLCNQPAVLWICQWITKGHVSVWVLQLVAGHADLATFSGIRKMETQTSTAPSSSLSTDYQDSCKVQSFLWIFSFSQEHNIWVGSSLTTTKKGLPKISSVTPILFSSGL